MQSLNRSESRNAIMWFPFLFLLGVSVAEECHKRDYGNGGHVCVCNSSHCDTVPPPEQVERPHYVTYTSNKNGLRFKQSTGAFTLTNQIFDKQILVDSSKKYQTILGWGGAFTDATGFNIAKLTEETQNKLLKSYFSSDGIEYSLCRVPIGGTDFSTRGYSYNDGDSDPKLKRFKLEPEDFQYKIPFIRKAQSLSINGIQLFASAWTAPKWMKTNGEYSGLGFLRTEMYQPWANYFLKFLDSYEKEGIRFWGLTTGNEPSLGIIPFVKINSVGWTPPSMAEWIRNNLGPTIRSSNHSGIKIMVLDDQRFFLPWFVKVMFEDKTTRDYVDGIAVHWYYDGILFPASLLTKTHEAFPDKFILGTEACHGDKPFQKHVDLGSWARGESYAEDIIEDVTNWASGWVDWNMALDLTGGPTYIGNNVDSPIIVNATADEFYKQPMYYCLGHFSKFVPRGSVRIAASGFENDVSVAAFLRPDNGTVVVLLNKKEKVVPVVIVDDLRGSTQIELSKRSITTLLYW